MNGNVLRFPVQCPLCGTESLATFPVANITEALLLEIPIRLCAKCHEWEASDSEIAQIREYLEVIYVSSDDRDGR